MTKTSVLFSHLSGVVNQLEIAGYIKEEAIASLKYLHWYKLRNIEKNLTLFCEYLQFLNLQNTDKIHTLGKISKTLSSSTQPHNLDYYFFSGKKLTKSSEQSYLKKIHANGYEVLTLIQGIKGILVLSIDEFCNASRTRMDIHQLLMERNPEYQMIAK